MNFPFDLVRSCPDMVPDSGLAKIMAGIATGFFVVSPRLLWLVGLLFVLNVVTSFWLTWSVAENGEYVSLIHSALQRAFGYAIAIVAVVLFSLLLGDIETMRRVLLGGIGGVETAVTLGMVARIVPRLRPLYLRSIKWVDQKTPIDMSSKEIESIIDEQT